jgi:hypothetical protein
MISSSLGRSFDAARKARYLAYLSKKSADGDDDCLRAAVVIDEYVLDRADLGLIGPRSIYIVGRPPPARARASSLAVSTST